MNEWIHECINPGEIPSSNVAAPAPTQQTTLVVSPPTPQPSFKQQETLVIIVLLIDLCDLYNK